MGSNSTNDVYYSFAYGISKINVRTEWDIAFSVPLQTATILINEGAGVELYSVGDTYSGTLLHTPNLPSRQPLYNNKSDWTDGAFNINLVEGLILVGELTI